MCVCVWMPTRVVLLCDSAPRPPRLPGRGDDALWAKILGVVMVVFWGAKAVQDVSHRRLHTEGGKESVPDRPASRVGASPVSHRDPGGGDLGGKEPVMKSLDLEMQKKKKENLKGYQWVLIPSEMIRVRVCLREEITTQMLAGWCQMLPQPLPRGREEGGKFLIAGEGGRVPLCLIRGCWGSHLLISLVLAVRRYRLLLAPTSALAQRKVPTYTWKYHGKPADSAFFFCPFKLPRELMTTG